jgi:hypothetical protein
MTCPKRHFGQVGQGAKKIIWGGFLIEIPNQNSNNFL